MALVKKLQIGGQADNNTLNNELDTQLQSFNLKSKDERKVRDALVKFRDYFKDSNGKSFEVDPLSQKYTVSGAGSEPFSGSPDEIHRGWLTGNLKIQNEQDAMSVAAAIYNKALTNVKGKTTNVNNPTIGTREAINIGDLGEFVISDIYGTKDNFKSQFGTIKNDEDRKTKIYDFAQQKIADYLKKSELGKDKFDYSDIENAKAIQDAITKKDWNGFLNATNKVKWEPSKFLLTEEQKEQLALEAKTKAEADALAAKTKASVTGIKPGFKTQKRYVITKRIIPRTTTPLSTDVGSGKIGNLGTEFKNVVTGEGSKTDWANVLDATAVAGDVVSLGGLWAGLGGGLTSTAATLGSDILRGNGLGETLGNVGMNLGFTALSLIPGAASAKIGLKGTKAVVKAAKAADAVEDVAKVAKYGVPEIKNAGKWIAGKTKSLVKPDITNVKRLVGVTKAGLIGAGLYSGVTSGIQAGKDVAEGGIGNISTQDVRGMFHGVNAANALRRTAQLHAGTKKQLVDEATTNIKLKNPPKGVDAELKVPKGTDTKVAIDKHFDDIIKPKTDQLAKLEANKTPENEKAIAELKDELKILIEGKANAKLDNGWMGIRGKVEKVTGLNNSKATYERVIRDKPDERQWYPKKFQEKAIAKLNKNNTVKSEEVAKEQFDIKNIKTLGKSGKSRSIDQKANVEKYLAERKARVTTKPESKPKSKTKGRPKNNLSTKVTKKQATSLNSSSLKNGGILKYQNPAQTLQLGSLDPKSLAFKAKNKAHLNWTSADKTAGIFGKNGEYTPEYLNRVKLITPEWFKANQTELQNRITQSGSSYKLNDINQLIRGATDSGNGVTWKNKKPGILHDLVSTSPTLETPIVKTNAPQVAQVVKDSSQDYDVDPSGNNWAAEQPPTTVATTPITPVVKDGYLPKEGNKQFDWSKLSGLKKYLPDATDLSNLAMYASTVATNRNVGNEQRQAVTDSMYKIPYMSNQYVRVDSPYTLQGEKQAAIAENKASRVAKSTSDIDKSMAARFTGAGQASAIRDKANVADQQRSDQLKGVQLQMNNKVSELNTKTLGQNRALDAQAFSKIHLINANQDLANNAALNNLILANARNLPAKQYKQGQTALYNAYTNPEYTKATEEYTKLNTDEGQTSYKTDYNTAVKNLGYNKPWEESSNYKSWQDAVTKAKFRVDALYKPIQNLMIAQQFQQQLLKSGGSLSKQDKIDIDKEKSNLAKEMKVLEMSFKAIMHNNEMLQKALIRVFK